MFKHYENNFVSRIILLFILLISQPATAKYLSPQDFENEDSRYKMLVFLSEACPCSRSHIEHVKDLMANYQDLSVYGVISEPAQNEKQKKAKDKYFSKGNFGFPIIEDASQTLVKKYKALKTPHVVLIRQTNLHEPELVYEGGLTDGKTFNAKSKKYIEQTMADLSSGKDVQTKKGFCLGCYIRRF